MSSTEIKEPSSYLNYLPGIYQAGAEKGVFIGRYLKIFEKILSGIDDGVMVESAGIEGIEQKIDRIHEFFAPETALAEFLDWLAGWMALVLREDWEEAKKRRLIRKIVPLYRIRGTKRGLEEYLKIYVGTEGADISIVEHLLPLQIGSVSTIGVDTLIGGSAPHYFIVQIAINRGDDPLEVLKIKQDAVQAILDLEKPAHTFYSLELLIPTMQIGYHSTVGEDTILGNWMI